MGTPNPNPVGIGVGLGCDCKSYRAPASAVGAQKFFAAHLVGGRAMVPSFWKSCNFIVDHGLGLALHHCKGFGIHSRTVFSASESQAAGLRILSDVFLFRMGWLLHSI